jgi:hypothetical protein
MIRRIVVLLAALALPSVAQAQNGGFIQYVPSGLPQNFQADGADSFGVRNGGTTGTPVPQTWSVYNFCDGVDCATGYERLSMYWLSNVAIISPLAAGTGTTSRVLSLRINGSVNNRIDLAPAQWDVILNGAGVFSSNISALYPATTDGHALGLSNKLWSAVAVSRVIMGSKSKSLTDAGAAVTLITVPIASNSYQAGEVIWSAESTDATDYRTTAGRVRWAGISKAATPTCPNPTAVGADLTASSNASTLVCTWTEAVNSTNCDIKVTCTDNTAGTQTMTIRYRVDMPTVATLVLP